MTLSWIYTVVEILYQELASPASKSDTFSPTELEIFSPDFVGKALVLVNPDASTERLWTVSSPYMGIIIVDAALFLILKDFFTKLHIKYSTYMHTA